VAQPQAPEQLVRRVSGLGTQAWHGFPLITKSFQSIQIMKFTAISDHTRVRRLPSRDRKTSGLSLAATVRTKETRQWLEQTS
jgi:hypothetical protein